MLTDLNIPHERDVPLGPQTWCGVGGCAEALAHPARVAQLAAPVARCRREATPLYVLGGGANLLVRDVGVPGIVIKLDAPCFRQMRIKGDVVTAGAGYDLPKLVMATAKSGLGGLECLAGIPGTVGGAVRMNAGGTFGEIGQSVQSVQVMDDRGRVRTRERVLSRISADMQVTARIGPGGHLRHVVAAAAGLAAVGAMPP